MHSNGKIHWLVWSLKDAVEEKTETRLRQPLGQW